MTRTLFALAAVALMLPAAALAKGPSQARIEGPGLKAALLINGSGESSSTRLGNLTQEAGFFPAMFGQQPDPTLRRRPKGALGPKYTITYLVPGPFNRKDTVKQDLYPYAQGGPVTYTRPGQPFFGGERTHGGWYRASLQLRYTLVDAGLPTRPGVATKAAPPSVDGRDGRLLGLLAALGGLLLTLAAAALVLRRRAGTEPAH